MLYNLYEHTGKETENMRNRNICKFVNDISSDRIDIKNFIYETDIETINSKTVLSSHRLTLIKSGEGTLSFDKKEYMCRAGTLIFGFSGEEVIGIFSEGTEYMYISFDGTRAGSLFRRFGITRTSRCFTNFDILIPLWYDSVSRAGDNSTDLAAESMLLYSFSRFSGMSGEKNTLLSKIIEHTEENFSDSELSLNSIAQELNYNPKYISHFFKENMHIGYSEYLRNYRIKYAVSLFDHGLDSGKNIAFMCGFSDPLYFSTAFKKVMGVSPRDYMAKTEDKKSAT